MNEETPWIWIKGIAALCDHRLPDDFPQGVHRNHEDSKTRSNFAYYESMSKNIRSGDIVWVRVNWLSFFLYKILPEIKVNFVLVTGDIDDSIPSDIPEESAAILDSPMILHWFAQNYDGTPSDKISPIPIGMDFHSIQQNEHWGVKQLSVTKQREVLEMINEKLKPMGSRTHKLYIDSQFSSRNDPVKFGSVNDLTRSDVYKMIHTDPVVHIQGQFQPQFEMWLQRGQFTFVLSHHGYGLDCHRTWEALVLGHVLVVQKSSLDPLYKDLPVIIIDDWNTINPLSVGEILSIDFNKNYRTEKLTNQYWIDKMRLLAKQSLNGRLIRAND